MLERRRGLPRLPLWAALVLIAIGFTAIAIAVSRRQDDRSAAQRPVEATPDIYLEDGDIAQFRDDGTLRYRLRADRISHFAQRGGERENPQTQTFADEAPRADERTTRLVAPALALHTPDAQPWHLAAQAGEYRNTGATVAPAEQVTLRGDVVLSQRHGDGRFTELRTAELTLHLGREIAQAALPVMMATESTRSTAAGFRADLAQGRFELYSSPSKRVSVAVESPLP